MRCNFYIFFSIIVLLIALSGCNKDEDVIITSTGEKVKSSSLIQGMMRIKVTEDFTKNIESLYSEGITHLERTFPDAGKFEARTRACGLHLWYDVYFDESLSLTKAGESLNSIQGIEAIEYRPKIVKLFNEDIMYSLPASISLSSAHPFNDPYLNEQWHYYNDGSKPNSEAGCDINLFPAWNSFTTGSPDVIVAVVDGGIDYSHEDLVANMWHNPEKSGNEQYGYNFVSNSYNITPVAHGTHVAGTISAVNNNGVGVCGIAGGDYASGKQGVKLMSCQVFEGDYSGDAAKAIKWSADHGAVISQNSWGYDGGESTPASDIAAFQYFINNAGMDENGHQVGPMAGGIILFAAGNDNRNVNYPGADVDLDCFISVTAVGADYIRSYYSNYGSWTDLSAPGGDKYKERYVISTIPSNQYGAMQGTSMACPHVSGVAALIVSHMGKQGFTNSVLEHRLLNYTNPTVNDYNPDYDLGNGLLDAFSALNTSGGSAPIITPLNGVTDTLRAYQKDTLTFIVTGSNQTSFIVEVKPGSDALTYTHKNTVIQIIITGKDDNPGTYQASLKVTDDNGLSDLVNISYTILENIPPVKIKDIDNQLFGSDKENAVAINLEDYFYDQDGEDLSYTYEMSDKNIVSASVAQGVLYLSPISYGYSAVTITASDVMGEYVSSSFKVLIRDASQEVDIYPNPVKDILKIRTSTDVSASVIISNSLGAVVYSGDVLISPFSPAEIDVRAFSSGTYVATITISGKTIKKNIVKL